MNELQAALLVQEYADLITRIGYTWLGNVHDAQDVCQSVLLRLLTASGLPADQTEARRYVVRAAINECKNLKKSAWFRRTTPLLDAHELAVELPEESDGALLAMVQALPQKYREVVYLHYYEGYSVAETAALLNRTPALVSTHLARARTKLKDLLGGENYGKQPI